MITVTSTIPAATAFLARIAHTLGGTVDETMDATLADLEQLMEAVNPVKTGRMKAGYDHQQVGPASFVMTDEAPYSGYVVGGTRRQRPNAALNQVLDEAETTIEAALDLAITRVVFDGR